MNLIPLTEVTSRLNEEEKPALQGFPFFSAATALLNVNAENYSNSGPSGYPSDYNVATITNLIILDKSNATKRINAGFESNNLNGFLEKKDLSAFIRHRENVAYFAESFADWGFKYKSGGTDVTSGVDCSGFINFVFKYFDTSVTRTSGDLYKSGISVDLKAAQPGDLVFFGRKNVEHVAMITKNDATGLWVVHSTSSRGIIKENIYESSYWMAKLKDKAVNIIGVLPSETVAAKN